MDKNYNLVLIQSPLAVAGTQATNVESYVFDERDMVHTRTVGGVTNQFRTLAAHSHIASSSIPLNAQAATDSKEYDANGNVAKSKDPMGRSTTYAYDGHNRQTTRFDPYVNRHENLFDPAGNLIRTRSIGAVGGQGPGGTSNPNNVGDGYVRLAEFSTQFDEVNRAYREDRSIFNPATGQALGDGPLTPNDGLVSTLIEYDRSSRIVRTVNDNLRQTLHGHDGADRRFLTTDHLLNSRRLELDASGNAVRIITTEKSPENLAADQTFTTINVYDNLDRLVRTTDSLGHTERNYYDSRNNVVYQSDASGSSISDPLGLYGGQINDHGNTIRQIYDGQSRLLSKIRDLRSGGVGSGTVTATIQFSFEHDANGRLAKATDANGNAVTYLYDSLNRKTSETHPDLSSKTLTYDANGNVLTTSDPNGNVLTDTYDSLNRIIQRSITPALGVVGTTLQTFQYDGLSRTTLATDNNEPSVAGDDSVVVRVYDSLGRALQDVQNGRNVANAYDGLGNRLVLTYPNGRTVSATYDGLERLDVISDAGGTIANYNYIGPKRVLERLYGTGGKEAFTYDADARILQVTHRRADSTLIAGYDYRYDRMDTRVMEKKTDDPANSELYAYDSHYRLVDFHRGSLNAAETSIVTYSPLFLQRQQWTLDKVSNWESTTTTIAGSATTESRTHSNVDELLTRTAAVTTTLDYDSAGNQIDEGENLYRWDALNRLRESVRESDNAVLGQYSYDAFDRRTQKVVTNSGSLDGTTKYYWDDQRPIEETNAAGVVQRQAVYGRYVDERLSLDRNLNGDATTTGPGDQRLYYHHNVVFSAGVLTSSTGVRIEGYHYDPYGRPILWKPGTNGQVDFGGDDTTVIGGTSSVDNAFLFTGREVDGESALYSYRARYLAPIQGRFISRDDGSDESFAAGSLYAYGHSNPANVVDPTGRVGALIKGSEAFGSYTPGFFKFADSLGSGSDSKIGKLYKKKHDLDRGDLKKIFSDAIKKNPKERVIMVGHSLGANEALELSNELKTTSYASCVDLLITVDKYNGCGATKSEKPTNAKFGFNIYADGKDKINGEENMRRMNDYKGASNHKIVNSEHVNVHAKARTLELIESAIKDVRNWEKCQCQIY